MRSIKIGLLGLGTVGGGTVSVLTRNAREIAQRAGHTITISHAAAKHYDRDAISGLDQIGKIGSDVFAVVNDPEVAIVIELIGGCSLAKELVLQAIANRKHVVTANKALIASHGNAIFDAAQRQGVMVGFEAAVTGGVPIIKAIREGLPANKIQWIVAILNGTSNYILTEMRERGEDFAAVLAEAQALGYAEADPTLDVEGVDAAHKLTILGSIAFGIPLQLEKVYTEGVNNIERQDVVYADTLGYCIKHLGIARKTERGIELRVHPSLIPKKQLIANVEGVMNAVVVMADAVGPTLYYGAGAGAEPTASAVIADVIDVVREIPAKLGNKVPHLGFQSDALLKAPVILDMEQTETAYYLRMQVVDRPGVLAKITNILGDAQISIESILQKEPRHGDQYVPIIILTQRVQEKQMNYALRQIEQLKSVNGSVTRIRMETLT